MNHQAKPKLKNSKTQISEFMSFGLLRPPEQEEALLDFSRLGHFGFMVPMHVRWLEVEAFHEPVFGARPSWPQRLGSGRMHVFIGRLVCIAAAAARMAALRFMASIHVRILEVFLIHEPAVWSSAFTRPGPPEGGTPNKSWVSVRLIKARLRRSRWDSPYVGYEPRTAHRCRNSSSTSPGLATVCAISSRKS